MAKSRTSNLLHKSRQLLQEEWDSVGPGSPHVCLSGSDE